MTRIGVVVGLLVAACGHPPPTSRTSGAPALDASTPALDAGVPPDATPEPPPVLAWRLSTETNTLRVDYSITNPTDERIYVFDQLLYGRQLLPDAIIVMQGAHDGEVRLVRALVWTGHNSRGPNPPAARVVEPGATLAGVAHAPLPLTAWHNFAPVDPLIGVPQTAVLEIGYATHVDPARAQMLDLDGTPWLYVDAPQTMLIGDALPIPTP